MASYLERYLTGERERVWDELVALTAAVREEPVYADALAVARETMRRARANIEMLIPRLVRVGYQFGYGWIQPPKNEPFGWRQRRDFVEMLHDVREQPPILTIDADVEEHIAERQQRIERLRELGAERLVEHEERHLNALRTRPQAEAHLDNLEAEIRGPLPLSIRAWYEVVGGVNFVGVQNEWVRLIADTGWIDEAYWEQGYDLEEGGHPMQYLEPLQILALGEPILHQIRVMEVHRTADGSYRLHIMPNEHEAYLERGQDSYPYEVEVPCPSADAPLLFERHETTFVNYLRICFRWGGFPGWERVEARPEQDLAFLTDGLLPL